MKYPLPALVSCTLLLLLGCGSDDTGEVPSDGGAMADVSALAPSISLGTGEREFVLLSNDDELEYILGPQGGYHFLGSVRVTGITPGNLEDRRDPTNPTTEFQAFRGSERIDIMASSYTQALSPVEGESGKHEMVGRLVILDTEIAEGLEDQVVRITVSIRDTDGVTLTDERTVVAVPHPNNTGPTTR